MTDLSSNNASFSGEQRTHKPCLCGDTHCPSDCEYLATEKCPQAWKADLAKQKRAKDGFQGDRTKAWADRTLQKHRDEVNNKASNQQGNPEGANTSASTNLIETSTSTIQTPTGDIGAFTCARRAFSATNYHLRSSWIRDNGSDGHVCSNTMLSRFISTYFSDPEDKLIAGT